MPNPLFEMLTEDLIKTRIAESLEDLREMGIRGNTVNETRMRITLNELNVYTARLLVGDYQK